MQGTKCLTFAATLTLLCSARADGPYFSENFEQGSAFSPVWILPDSGYSRDSLDGVPGAPSTNPSLHINQGGDKEFRYSSSNFYSISAVAPGIYSDVRIDGYIGLGMMGVGSLNAGFILRALGNDPRGPSDYYFAHVGYSYGDGTAGLNIARVQNYLVNNLYFGDILIPNFDPLHEDYHVTFQASGTTLSASIAREQVVNGVVVETLIGSVSGTDTGLTSGKVGLHSLDKSPDSVFYDDITVSPVPEPQTMHLLWVSVAMVISNRRRRAKPVGCLGL